MAPFESVVHNFTSPGERSYKLLAVNSPLDLEDPRREAKDSSWGERHRGKGRGKADKPVDLAFCPSFFSSDSAHNLFKGFESVLNAI